MIRKITHKPPRFHEDYSSYFLTFCTFQRERYLHREGIPEMLIDNLTFYGNRLKQLLAYTIMPDHIHLFVEVNEETTLSHFLRDFKKRTSKEIKRILSIDTDHIWQHGTMDHCIRCSWTNNDLANHVQYIFYNSWKHLEIAPKDFRYHNFNQFVANGWLDHDFCSFNEAEFPLGKVYE